MMKGRVFVGFIAFLLIACQGFASNTPLGGLAVTVSPDGKTIAAAGDNRTLYMLDAETLNVTNRSWLGSTIVALSFNKSGSTIVAQDSGQHIYLIDAKTGEITKTMEDHGKLACAENADIFAAIATENRQTILKVYSMTDFSEKKSIPVELEKRQDISAIGLSPDGKSLAFFTEAMKDEDEAKAKAPKELRGFERKEFELKNDGRTCVMGVFNTATGAETYRHKLYYSPSVVLTHLTFDGEDVIVTNYTNVNARITPKGEVTVFQLKTSTNYGLGFSADPPVLG